MGTSVTPQNPADAIWSGGQGIPKNPADQIWQGATGVSPNAAKAAHITRIKGALANKEAAEAEQESPTETFIRSLAKGTAGMVGRLASGAGQILSAPNPINPAASSYGTMLNAGGAALQHAAANVAPTDENVGRSPTLAATGETIGEAAPQFVAGHVAGLAARPMTNAITSAIPALAPQVGPAVAEGTTKIGQAFKAGVAALPGNFAANTAFQAVADPEHPVTPVSAGLSLLGAAGEAGGASARVGSNPRIRGAPTYYPLSDADLASVKSATEAPDAAIRARILARTPLGGESTVTGEITRRPMRAAETTETANEIAAQMKADEAARAAAEPERTPFSTPDQTTARRPAGEPSSPVVPAPLDQPIATADTRLAVDRAQKVIEANMVTPNPNPAPIADEAMPEGFSTKSTETARRAAPAEPTLTAEDASVAAKKAFQSEPEQTSQEPTQSGPKYSPTVEELTSQGYTPSQVEYLLRKHADRVAGYGDAMSWTEKEVADNADKYPRFGDSGTTTIYRVVPKGKGINTGDYVFTDRAEAEKFRDENGKKRGQPDISTMEANKADLIVPDAGSPHESIYAPRVKEGESVSVGRDLNAPSRIPKSVPSEPTATGKGVEPTGTVETPDGAVSAGTPPSPKEIATRAAAKVFAPDSPELAAFSQHMDAAFPEEGGEHVPAPDVIPEGEGKNVPASKLLNTEKLGLKTPEQDATVQADLERLKSAGVDRERIGLDAQTAAAKQNINGHLKFMLTDLDEAKAGKLSGAEIGQLYENLSNNAAQRTALLKEASDPTITPERAAQIDELMTGLQKDADAMAGNIVKGTAQKGRDLNYLRQVAQQSSDPGVWLAQAKRALGDRPLDDETQSLIVKLANAAKAVCG